MPILMDSDGNPVYLPPTEEQMAAQMDKALAGIDAASAELAAEKLAED